MSASSALRQAKTRVDSIRVLHFLLQDAKLLFLQCVTDFSEQLNVSGRG